jgi:diguanylate cyclase (GGDEF)-like protein
VTYGLVTRVIALAIVAFATNANALAGEARQPAALGGGRINFKSYTIVEGLGHGSVRAILQDRMGFIWVGTQDGLARFDGRATDVFRHSRNDPDSIGDNHVTSLVEDAQGRLWAAHFADGVSRYDPRNQRWVHYLGERDGLPSAQIKQLALDRDGGLWVLTFNGAIRRWNEAAARFEAPEFALRAELPPVSAMALRAAGGIWLGTDHGLWSWDGSAPRAMHAGDEPAHRIGAVLEEQTGAVWIGTAQDGLWRRDPAGVTTRVPLSADDARPADISALLLDQLGRLWVATRVGVVILDTARLTPLAWEHHRPGDPHSLAADRVVALCESADGQIWVGSWSAGMSVHDPRTEAFVLITGVEGATSELSSRTTPAVLANPDGTFWAAGDGVVLMDVAGHVLKRYQHASARSDSLASNYIMTLARDHDGRILVGTADSGLDRLRPDGASAEHLHDPASEPGLGLNGGIRGLYVDRDGSIWSGTVNDGIAVRCLGCANLKHFQHRADDAKSFPVGGGANCFLRTRSGELWVGSTAHGILRLDDAEHGRFSVIAGPIGARNAVSHGAITYLYEDLDGTVWAATQGGGLNRIRRTAGGEIVGVDVYTTEDGLSADAIGVILRDRTGQLWMSTTRGISRIDPASGRIEAFEPRQGAQLSYYIGSGDVLADGRFIFGGFDGVTVFDPADVVAVPESVRPLLTDLRLFNERVLPGANAPLPQAPGFTDHITLNYRQNVVTLGFTAPVFRNASLLNLAYRLDGRDNEWIRADPGQRSASYSDLAAGDYRFRVRAWTGASPEHAAEAAIALRMRPPPWATPWAYAGYSAAALLLALLISWPILARVRERRAARLAIELSEQRLKLALWGSGDELWEIDLAEYKFHRDHRLPGISTAENGEETTLADFTKHIHVADQPGYESRLQAVKADLMETFEHAFRIHTIDDDWKWLNARGRVVARDALGLPKLLAGTHQDVTALKLIEEHQRQLQDALRHQAFHDALTGLANRALFYEQLTLALAPQEGRSRMCAVAIADLDDFKLVNDSLGPSVGDRMLCAVADRLQRLISEDAGMVARLGGDEFVLLLERTSQDQAFVLADRVMRAFRQPFDDAGQRLHATASIGLAFAQSGQSAHDALRNADMAMHRAKSLGRNRIEVFSPELHEVFSRRLATVTAVRRAIEDEALLLHYQPIVELQTGRWVGAEALARLQTEDPALASPDSFIPIAEEAGLIDELGEMILRQAIADAPRVGEGLPDTFFITVNVSPHQLQQPGFAAIVESVLRDSNWSAQHLVVEVTESTLMTVIDISRANLARIRALGVRLALDDFGTGYSSLAQLGRERFDILKIAKPFVDGLPGSTESMHMAEAIVRMAESLRMSVIAEGVEHPAQAEALRRLGCSYAQGYEFARPMPASKLAAMSNLRMM